MSNKQPVIFVHGMFGFGPEELGGFDYWGSALEVPSPLPRINASVGPISSPHDRACELAAQLKGVPVDYGEVHSLANGHDQYGQDFSGKGLLANWSTVNPVHFVGHSLGAQTIRCLHFLLAEDFWGWGSSSDWITSISSISGSLNGSTATYYWGVDEKTGLLRRSSGITAILRLIEFYTAFNGTILDDIYDFDLDHWGFKQEKEEDLMSYLKRVSESQFFWGGDNALYAASLQGAFRDNGRWPTYSDTYYFSYITEHTLIGPFQKYQYPSLMMNPALFGTSFYIGRKRFSNSPIPVKEFSDSEWWENDGLVSSFSAIAPHTNGIHPIKGEITSEVNGANLIKGQWHYQWERGMDHGALCFAPHWWQRKRHRQFYTKLFVRLADLNI